MNPESTNPALTPFAESGPVPEDGPHHDCPVCARMLDLHDACRGDHQDWWDAPVPAYGDPDAWLVIIDLAPGQQGEAYAGQPFAGDSAGTLLFDTLARHGFVQADHAPDPQDDPNGDGPEEDGSREGGPQEGGPEEDGGRHVQLNGAMIVNAVGLQSGRDRPTAEAVRSCRPLLADTIERLPHARIFVALGQIAHQSAVKVLGGRLPKAPFAHLAEHRMPGGRMLIDSQHASWSNISSGRLTTGTFDAVFERALALRDQTNG